MFPVVLVQIVHRCLASLYVVLSALMDCPRIINGALYYASKETHYFCDFSYPFDNREYLVAEAIAN